jgi:hypothetical protein
VVCLNAWVEIMSVRSLSCSLAMGPGGRISIYEICYNSEDRRSIQWCKLEVPVSTSIS